VYAAETHETFHWESGMRYHSKARWGSPARTGRVGWEPDPVVGCEDAHELAFFLLNATARQSSVLFTGWLDLWHTGKEAE
jgi:hypothetical protein